MSDTPWPPDDVVRKLADAADLLLYHFGYDGHGHEEIAECGKRAREHLARPTGEPAPPLDPGYIRVKVPTPLGYDVRIETLDGREVQGVYAVHLHAEPSKFVEATLTVRRVTFDMVAKVTGFQIDPEPGTDEHPRFVRIGPQGGKGGRISGPGAETGRAAR